MFVEITAGSICIPEIGASKATVTTKRNVWRFTPHPQGDRAQSFRNVFPSQEFVSWIRWNKKKNIFVAQRQCYVPFELHSFLHLFYFLFYEGWKILKEKKPLLYHVIMNFHLHKNPRCTERQKSDRKEDFKLCCSIIDISFREWTKKRARSSKRNT